MKKKIAVLSTASASGEVGGAERFYQGLRKALSDQGADAEIVSVVSDESDFDSVLRSYLKFYDLDLSVYDGVISTKAPGYLVRHPNHVCYLQHTMRAFYDMFEVEFPNTTSELIAQRERIQTIDTAALSSRNVRKLFVIGEEVRRRLLHYNGLEAEVLYQATSMGGFRCGSFDYMFMPGRLHRWKRVDLVIRAMRHVKKPVRLLISGTGEDGDSLMALARDDHRITFLGSISDEELIGYYANALAIPFVPYREDFGLVAVEAFHSGKPVVTCIDSGEPMRMVKKFDAGIVCEAAPESIGAAIDKLHANPGLAVQLGSNGREAVQRMSWETTATKLLDALGFDP
ncbi:MAG: glycosyltransferase family 4 protein [Metallibacterium sp.]